MIDIFVKENNKDNITVYFIQLGCIYKTTYSALETLCDNVVSLYTEFNTMKNGYINFQYLPINIYNPLYKKDTHILFENKINEKIHYTVKKVC